MLLDATAVPADRRGVGRYVDSLIPALVRTGTRVQVICQPADADHYGALSGQDPISAPSAVRRPVRLVWEQIGLPLLMRRARPDVLHSPHYTHPFLGPAVSGVPVVVTLHDATFFSDPVVHTRVKGPFFRGASRLALKRARLCLVPSQATADELVAHAGADPKRLKVAYLGVDTAIFAPPEQTAIDKVRATLGLSDHENYVAFLGTMEPRKNIPALIQGWIAACQNRPNPPALVLAGGSGWDTALDAVAATVPATLRLIRPGYLAMDDLPALLGGATVFAYPSLGEGFGLPVLEAMACGVPVLTTRKLALAEVGGDAVAYTETDEASIAGELMRLLDDPARRKELSKAGPVRAATFSWDACAASHVQAYERAITEGSR